MGTRCDLGTPRSKKYMVAPAASSCVRRRWACLLADAVQLEHGGAVGELDRGLVRHPCSSCVTDETEAVSATEFSVLRRMASTPRAPRRPNTARRRPNGRRLLLHRAGRKRVAAQALDWPTEKRSWKTSVGIGSVGVYADSRRDRAKVRFYVKYTTQLRIGGKRVQNKHGVFETAQERTRAKAKAAERRSTCSFSPARRRTSFTARGRALP